MALLTYSAADTWIIATSDLFSRIFAGTPSASAPGGTTTWLGTTALAPTVAPLTDDGPMEDDAPRSGQRLIFESAAFQVSQVSDNAAVADDGGESRSGMHDGAVLDGRSRPHRDGSVVAPEDGARPHARFGANRDITDDDGVGVDKGVGVDARRDAFDFVDGHGRGRYTWPAIQVTP